MMSPAVLDSGHLGPGLPFLRLGEGPPLVFLPGLTADHDVPRGQELRMQLDLVRPFAAGRTVWWINRRRGLPAGATMADLARDYADVLRELFDGPVDVLGHSTGGSVALQLALDHPGLVRRLVLLSSAYRLGTGFRTLQRDLARLLREHRVRRASARLLRGMAAGPATGLPLGALGWLLGRRFLGGGGPDLLATLAADDAFDAGDRLHGLQCPLLVVGGGRDAGYGTWLFTETARRAPDGRVVLYPRRGHLGTPAEPGLPAAVRRFLDAPG